jgi:hypothetical protein
MAAPDKTIPRPLVVVGARIERAAQDFPESGRVTILARRFHWMVFSH